MCPPRPDALFDAVLKLQKKIKKESILTRKEFMDGHKIHFEERDEILVLEEESNEHI